MIRFSPSLTVIDGFWSSFKAAVSLRGLNSVIQYDDDGVAYTVFAVEGYLCFTCVIYKTTVPAGNYTQEQNDLDKADFEANFLPYANRSVDDIPSRIIANALKTSGGSANLAVNGSVTPVVFEYSPPSGFDVEIGMLSLLFEDSTAIAFGNRFVLTGISTLANGLLLEVKAGDVITSPWQTMRRTRDLIEISEDFDVVTGTINFLRAKIHLPKSLYLSRAGTFTNPDYVRVTVRDDLSSLDFAEAHFQGVKL
jgi:hypothetical protein